MAAKEKQGYTLVELMVVVTIIAILTATSTPVFTGYIKKAKNSKYLAECRTIYMAAEASLSEISGRWERTEAEDWLLAEIERLTTCDVKSLNHADETLDAEYGIVISEFDSESYVCEAVLCMIDGERWIFEPEDGSFSKMD